MEALREGEMTVEALQDRFPKPASADLSKLPVGV
jgi:hypothetical protein